LLVLSKCIHPKIVQFLGFHRGNIKTSILFEFMSNGNLEEYIKCTAVPVLKKIEMMIDVVKALHYLHNRYPETVLHRDMKPSNILINKHGEAKLSDFGISKMVKMKYSSDFTDHSNEKGTYVWMSPEVLKGEPYNYTSDIFSIGLIIYYIWTEQYPYKELNLSTIQMLFQKNKGNLKLGEIDNHYELNVLTRECVLTNPVERPNTQNILNRLNCIKETIKN
jgi:serine/threonine protein kinase